MAGLEKTTGHITHLMESIWSAVTGASQTDRAQFAACEQNDLRTNDES